MTRRIERAVGAACGLVPLVGMAFFGWSVAAVLFTLVLDAYLSSLRMIPANLYLIAKYQEWDPQDPRNAVIDWMCNLGLAAVMWIWLALPVMVAAKSLDILVKQFHPGGFEPVAYDLIFDTPWFFASLVGGRLFLCVREFAVARAAGQSRFAEMIKNLYGLLFCKGVVLFALGSWIAFFGVVGFKSETILVAAVIVGLVAFEWYADRRFHPDAKFDPVAAARKKIEVIHGFDGRNDK
jgi:hypothetical protein